MILASALSAILTAQAVSGLPPSEYAGRVVCRDWKPPKNLSQKVVAFTFDDGPDPAQTPKILKILAEEQIPATFFVVGRAACTYTYLIVEEGAQNHVVGNHSWFHDPNINDSPRDMISLNQIIQVATGKLCQLYRPPMSNLNTTASSYARAAGMITIMWTFDSHDYDNFPSELIQANFKESLQPGTIVLMHDEHQKPNAVGALQGMIRYAKSLGYRCVDMNELLQIYKADGYMPPTYP